MIQTPVCQLLGIDYPVLQGGMAWIADGALAAAVSNGGGLGIIAAGNAPAEAVAEQIQIAKSRTDRPFGLNIMMISPYADDIAALAIREHIAVVTTGAGNPGKYMPEWKAAGIKVIPVIASVAMAKRMTRLGADALIAEGGESGGHIGELTTMVLTPLICDATELPVIAAGGIADGRGFAAASVFETAEALRPGIKEMCFHGGADVLSQTENTQPCLFTTELAAAAALTSKGISADMAAGFSLGELSALTLAKAGDFAEIFSLVCRRGALMAQAAAEHPAAMAAILKLCRETVENLCGDFKAVYPVNFNCPGQITVSGAKEEIKDFCAAVKAAGGRVMPLKVTGGFHSPFMAEAANAFQKEAAKIAFAAPEIPVYANCTGEVYSGDTAALLTRQITSPVYWETSVAHMIAAGADTFIQVGPGETLCGMIKRIDPKVKVFHISDGDSLKQILSEVSL